MIVTINTEDGDTFESVFHWVQADRERNMAIVKKVNKRAQEEKNRRTKVRMPGTPVPFGLSKGNINNNNVKSASANKQLRREKALVAFKILSRSREQRRTRGKGRGMCDDDEEEDCTILTTGTTNKRY